MLLHENFAVGLLALYNKLFGLENCFFDEDKAIYSPDKGRLLCCNLHLKSYNILEDTLIIGSGAFAGCTGLEKVNIPNSVTTIGYLAFYQCSALQKIKLPQSIKKIQEGKSTSYNLFDKCDSLKSILIPRGSWEWYARKLPEYKELYSEYLEEGCIPGKDIKFRDLAERRLAYILKEYKNSNSKYDYDVHYLGMDSEYCYYSVSVLESEYDDFNYFEDEDNYNHTENKKYFNNSGLIIAVGFHKTYTKRDVNFKIEGTKVNESFKYYGEFGAYLRYKDYERLKAKKEVIDLYNETGCHSYDELREELKGPDGEENYHSW